MQTLYRKNALGIGVWSIWSDVDTIHIGHSSTLDGSMVRHTELVDRGCQGRSIESQVDHRIRSRISKQRDKGYVNTIDEAATGAFNQLGLMPPMLAQVYGGRVADASKAWIQKKLNGLRCLITRQDGQLTAYTRRGKRLLAITEILAEADTFVTEGQTVDGEIYKHGTSLQTIQSLTKRRQAATASLLYAMYDLVSDDAFSDRHDELADMVKGRGLKRCIVLPKVPYVNEENRALAFKTARENKFEGLMIRIDGPGYESNKRSSALLKDKAKLDIEVTVIAIELSTKGNPVCMVMYNGLKFKMSPPGSDAEKVNAYNNKAKYIGKRLTVEYRELTDSGIPFHAVATAWRND